MSADDVTTERDPQDGSLVQREGVNAGSARSTGEGPTAAPGSSADDVLTGGTSTGVPGDAPEIPSTQVWAESAGGVEAPEPGTESGQDGGSIA